MNTRLLIGTLAVMGILGGCRAATARSYEACVFDTDCAYGSDRCIQVRYNGASMNICSSSCSLSASSCPPSASGIAGSCVSFDSGASFHCYQTCTSVAGCGFNQQCVVESGGSTTQICLPAGGSSGTVAAYSGCAAGMTCVAGTSCLGVKNGARTLDLCTRTNCASDNDCPFDRRGGRGLCTRLDGDAFNTCVERCNTSGDCTYPAAEQCLTRTTNGAPLGAPACLPI